MVAPAKYLPAWATRFLDYFYEPLRLNFEFLLADRKRRMEDYVSCILCSRWIFKIGNNGIVELSRCDKQKSFVTLT